MIAAPQARSQVNKAARSSSIGLALLLLAFGSGGNASAHGTPGVVPASIVPAASRTVWAPGIRQAMPVRPACALVSATSYGNGLIDASAAIQAAIDACPVGQAVQLTDGVFLVNARYLLLNRGVTLRGAGPAATKLLKTNGATPLSYQPQDAQPLVIIGPSRWPRTNDSTSVNLSRAAEAGARTVTVDNAVGLAPGQFVLLDQDDYSTASWHRVPRSIADGLRSVIWASDRVVFQRHRVSESTDDPFPSSLSWFSRAGRPLNEIKEIVAVAGRDITFSTPVHAGYTRHKGAQLTQFSEPFVRGAGLEELAVEGGGDGNIRFESAAYSWAKNVESLLWVGDGVAVNRSFRVEVRDSFIHDTAWPQPGGAGYGISMAAGSSEVLVENNAVLNVNKVIVVRSSGAGSVVGYNYLDNGFILGAMDWVEVGLNGSHMVGSHHVLFEGNEAWNYDSDNTHGNAIAMTVFRNNLVGRRTSFPGMVNARGVGLMFGSWWHSFIGNVIGEPGRMTDWVLDDPGDGTYGGGSNAWGSWPAVWKLGYNPLHWDQMADPKVVQTTFRHGNFDYVSNQVQWTTATRQLPASLYLASKPAFFGQNPWPWVNPTGATKLGVLPAKVRVGPRAPLYVVPPPS